MRELAIFTVVCGALVGCDGAPDVDVDAGTDAGEVVVGCESAADGAPCAGGNICVGGVCAPSACGDGYVDEALGEECEDGNAVAFDGCEPGTCSYTCTSDASCDDGVVCNGEEHCDGHVCTNGPPAADGAPCSTDEVPEGVCHPLPEPVCQVAACGNLVRDPGEACDDGRNGDDADGCTDECALACAAPTCALEPTPSFFDFGALESGMVSAEHTFMLHNISSTLSTIPVVEIVGDDDIVELSNTCTERLAPTDSCEITVRFEPEGAGPRRAMLLVTAGPDHAGAAELRGLALGTFGEPCTAASACASAACTDGVCCDVTAAECGGCRACNVAGSEGTCTNVPAGVDPHGECAGGCEVSGECNGSGGCRAAASGTLCNTSPCRNVSIGHRQIDDVYDGRHLCDGTSTVCPATSTTRCPGNFTCDDTSGACRTECTIDTHCRFGFWCNAGTCMFGGGNGAACTRDAQCSGSYVCASGVCRECATNLQCSFDREKCNAAGECEYACSAPTLCAASGWGNTCGSGGCVCASSAECTWDTAPSCVAGSDGLSRCGCGLSRPCRPWEICVSDGYCLTRTGNSCVGNGACASGSCVDHVCT
jgi:hypothetical protein